MGLEVARLPLHISVGFRACTAFLHYVFVKWQLEPFLFKLRQSCFVLVGLLIPEFAAPAELCLGAPKTTRQLGNAVAAGRVLHEHDEGTSLHSQSPRDQINCCPSTR